MRLVFFVLTFFFVALCVCLSFPRQMLQYHGPCPKSACSFVVGVSGALVSVSVMSRKEHEYSQHMLALEVCTQKND